MPNSNYGKYEAPKFLEEIIQLQKQLNKQGLLPHGDLLGNYFAYQTLDERYMNTPLDAIGFAYPGMDGMHFAFLTDFGTVSDLSDAYIVRVSPMEFDCPVRIIARNLKDFISISVAAIDAFYMIDITKSQEEIEEYVKEYPPIPLERLLSDSEYVVERKVIETLQVEPIEDLVSYYRELKQMREQEVMLHTEDSIGVGGDNSSAATCPLFDFTQEEYLSVEAVSSFFDTAPLESKLAFLRDAQSKALIFEEEEMKSFLYKELIHLGYVDEAKRVAALK